MDLIKKDPNVLSGITDGICSYFLEKGYYEKASFRDIFNSMDTIKWNPYLISSVAKGILGSYFTYNKKKEKKSMLSPKMYLNSQKLLSNIYLYQKTMNELL